MLYSLLRRTRAHSKILRLYQDGDERSVRKLERMALEYRFSGAVLEAVTGWMSVSFDFIAEGVRDAGRAVYKIAVGIGLVVAAPFAVAYRLYREVVHNLIPSYVLKKMKENQEV